MKNEYQIDGSLTIVYLPRKDGSRLEMLVDTIDLPRLLEMSTITWYGTYKESTQSFYAQAHVPGTKQGKMYFHRWVTGADRGMDIDHINHNTLDNRRSNLRQVTRAQNMLNQKNRDYRNIGVRFHKRAKKWEATARVNGKAKYVGLFTSKDEAISRAKSALEETA